MSANVRVLVVGLVVGTVFPARVDCGDQSPPPVNGCAGAADNDFEDELWAKVGIPKCLTCHRQGGDADESKFVLADPRKSNTSARNGAMRHNRDAFARMARVKEKGQSRLLLKVAGELDHGGGDVVKPDSSAYRMLAEFVRRESAGTTLPGRLLSRWTATVRGTSRAAAGCSAESVSRWPDGSRLRRNSRSSPGTA